MAFLNNGPEDAATTLLLAHGAGAAMDTPFMSGIAERLGAGGIRVLRFEFSYMAGRRTGGPKKPPPKMDVLAAEFLAAIDAASVTAKLVIGGKSMGGRVASLIADDLYDKGRISGLVCLGYPFHPPGKPEKLRTDHLEGLKTPALICQGTRDTFGSEEEVSGYPLSGTIALNFLEDGDHDFRPRKSMTNTTWDEHLDMAAGAIARFMGTV